MKEATILVKLNKTDQVYREILVRDGEYYHPQLFRWFGLPKTWIAEEIDKEEAEEAAEAEEV